MVCSICVRYLKRCKKILHLLLRGEYVITYKLFNFIDELAEFDEKIKIILKKFAELKNNLYICPQKAFTS